MKKEKIHIVGAGPAGLVAAINLARNGYPVTIYEMKDDVGKRFNGDYQGIENWSSDIDARQFLNQLGLANNFRFEPCKKGDFFNPNGEQYHFQMSRPLFYLVERGCRDGSLDQGLKKQALQAGVEFEWEHSIHQAPPGKVIASTGPQTADAIARGIVFNTSHQDYYAAFLDDEVAPQGYAYLVVNNGRATFATCMFSKFSDAHSLYKAALYQMREHVDIDINEPRYFGGYVNFFLNQPLVKADRIYYVGETAGFQDALFGFGMRYAMHSGYLAAKSIMEGLSYKALCEKYIIPKVKVSLVNRWLFTRLENLGYTMMLDRLKAKDDIIPSLIKQHKPTWYKRALFPIARRSVNTRFKNKSCSREDCSCIRCLHGTHEMNHTHC